MEVLKSSYDALKFGGLAIHVLDKEEYTATAEHLTDGLYAVPLTRWKTKLADNNMRFLELPLKTGPSMDEEALALILIKPIS